MPHASFPRSNRLPRWLVAAAFASAVAPSPALAQEVPKKAPHQPEVAQQKASPGFLEKLRRGTTVGGYAQVVFHNEDEQNSSFTSQRFVLALLSKIHPRLTAIAEVELERGGSPEKRGGELHFGEVILEQALLDFRVFDWLVARAGVLLVPFGNFNALHDAPRQELSDRPISDLLIIPTTWFEVGAGFHGGIPIGGMHELSYELYLINGLDSKLADGLGTRAARGSLAEDNNNDKAVAAQLRYSPHPIVDLGLSLYSGDYDLQDNRVWMVGGDAIVTLGRLELIFSYAKLLADEGFNDSFPAGSTANTRSPVPTGMNGLFAEARYKVPLRRLMPDDLKTASMTLAARYTEADTDEDVRSVGDKADFAVGLNFRPVLPAVFKAELHWLRNGAAGDDPSLFADFFDKRASLRFVGAAAYAF